MHPDHTAPTSTQPPAPSRGGRRLRNIVVTLALGATMFAVGAVMLTPGGNTAPRAVGRGQPDEATRGSIEALQARVARLPKDPGGWAALGMAYVQQARSTADPATYDRAEKALQASLSAQGEGNTDAETAMGALAAARHDFPAALRWARKATTSGPYSSSAYGVLADAHTQLGHYDKADEAVQKMTDLRPDAASLARASYAFELKGNTSQARALMKRSLSAAATPADKAFAHSVLAGLDLQDANPREALARTQTALRTAPSDSALLETRARAYLALGDTSKAVADYRAAIAIAPLPHYLLGLGELEQALGHRERAVENFDLLRAQDRIREAADEPADTDAILFEADHGNPRRAVTLAEETLRNRPFVAVHDAYAWALHRAGRDAEALVQADRALAQGTRSALFRYHRGVIHHALGDPEAARRDLTEALREPGFHPLHSDAARELLQRIDTTP
ncbi:tetratricopeptide repeat protein [Streptomyces sp. MBT56]|uniref:tetratricopeptide repeat protein n=1 Tax=unclassified Streptomyces TaxID=2593676 RepID=UPI00190D0C48|nr:MULTISPECIES: tetratricopeptide repeat protein [unclassified Streptomyces]MBK3557587.1 tetratricopeptide repeat protein [Streptomyces sp. MBT56]MBK3606240.1 tetratricopeptide repeat protein [Streptomyces sp. MBT54]MBK3615091.1 tetratricopeptide repeat protein [Streptomyces sp. MBT98]MBK6042362.1 tetratricopeptide repeat protein [Streptomyces sp. MBT55]